MANFFRLHLLLDVSTIITGSNYTQRTHSVVVANPRWVLDRPDGLAKRYWCMAKAKSLFDHLPVIYVYTFVS